MRITVNDEIYMWYNGNNKNDIDILELNTATLCDTIFSIISAIFQFFLVAKRREIAL